MIFKPQLTYICNLFVEFMGKGFGPTQEKIIKYYEEHRCSSRNDVVRGIYGNNYKKSQENNIRRAIQSLIEKKVIIKCRIKSLRAALNPSFKIQAKNRPLYEMFEINTKNELYRKFKLSNPHT